MLRMAENSSEMQSTMMGSNSHPETPPPSPPINEHQTEAKIEYTDSATLKLTSRTGNKRRSASSDLEGQTDHQTVPPVEFKDPSDAITKAPSRQHSNHDEIELEEITNAFDDVLDCRAHDHEERSTGESDAHSAGTVSAKSTHRLIAKKFEDDEPDGVWYECMIGCCTCLGFFCFT